MYGTYLAGLTSSVSLPPVNQSLTIMTAVYLVTASITLAVPVSLYLPSWPNLIYGMLSGTVFICTTAINCLIFVPQVRNKQLLNMLYTHVWDSACLILEGLFLYPLHKVEFLLTPIKQKESGTSSINKVS